MDSDFVPVFFDLETTGSTDWDEIIQIGAVTKPGKNTFNRHAVPSRDIPEIVSKLTGFEKRRNVLYQHGKKLKTITVKQKLNDFIDYLWQFKKPVILVAHGAFTSDCRFIIRYYKEYDLLDELSEVVQGFCDSVPLLEEYLPDMRSHKLKHLVKDLIWPDFKPHDALGDSKGLAAIFRHEKLGQDEIFEFSRSFDKEVQNEERRVTKKNLATFTDLKSSVPFYILKKMAKDNLDLDSLQECLREEEPQGLEEMLSEILDDGRPRITSKSWILNNISNAVEETLDF